MKKKGPMENAPPVQNDQKTVLVVDSDAEVLKFVGALLTDSNYRVLSAHGGPEAVQQAKDYKGEIDLLLSEFQMAGMSGVDLATQISHARPHLKVLLMSQFPDGMLVLNEGWHFLSKPFIPSQLRTLVIGLVSPDRASRFVETATLPAKT